MIKWEIVDYERKPGDQFIVHAVATPGTVDAGHYPGAEMLFHMDDGHPVLVSLTIEDTKQKAGEYNRLAPELVRTFPVATFATQVELALAGQSSVDDALPDHEALRREWPKGDLDKVSKEVARLYNLAAAENLARQQFVADTFEVSKATAGRMISKARELGHIRISGAAGRPKQKDRSDGTQTPRRRRIGDNIHKESK